MRKEKTKKTISAFLVLATILFIFPQTIFAAFSVTTGSVSRAMLGDNAIKATIRGSANPDGKKIIGYFKYVVFDSAPSSTPNCNSSPAGWSLTFPNKLGDGDSAVAFDQIMPFPKNKVVYYCAVARNLLGIVRFGDTFSFVSNPDPVDNSGGLMVVTQNNTTNLHVVHTAFPVTKFDDTTATISGSATLTKTPVYGYFRYSPIAPGEVSPVFCNEVFGDDMKSTNAVLLGNANTDNPGEASRKTFSTDISGLEPNTTYYYCAVASEKYVIEYGPLAFFTTAPDPSFSSGLGLITTKPASTIGANSARLNGFYNTAVNASTWFEYRKKRSYQDIMNGGTQQAQAVLSGIPFSTNNFNQAVSNISTTMSGTPTLNPTLNSIWTITNTGAFSATPTLISSTSATKGAPNPYVWSGKINYQSHLAGQSGVISYFLKNLDKDSTYQFRAAIETNIPGYGPQISYGDVLAFRTSTSKVTDGDVTHVEDENIKENDADLNLGDISTPPDDAVVHYHEGIEHVLVRQLMRDYNIELIEKLGYQDSMNLETFAWDTADFLARTFGYVSPSGKEIRVGPPDMAAYRLIMKDGKLTIYEYFNSKIVAIQDITSSLRGNYEYEYYYTKKVSE